MSERKIVIIDDDQDFTEAMRIFLTGHGFAVSQAENGKEGLALVKRIKPDLILLDVMMDYLNEGFVVAGELKKDPELAGIPVIFITGFEEHMTENMDTFSTALAAWNASGIMNKPVQPEELLKKINRILES